MLPYGQFIAGGDMTDEELSKALEEDILPPLAQLLKDSAEILNNASIESFGNSVEILIKSAMRQYLVLSGVASFDTLSQVARKQFLVAVLLALNGVLPVDHKYIMIAVRVKDEAAMQFLAITRSKLEGSHEMINPRIAPIGEVETRQDLFSPGLKLRPIWPDDGNLPADPTIEN